jgi:hypothetical protein
MSTVNREITGRRPGATRRVHLPSEAPLTMTVPEAGRRYFNMSRNASYAAAERGEIPTMRVGKLLRVPVRAMEALLDGVSRKQASGM